MSEVKPSLGNVLEAIDTLFKNDDKFAKKRASKWLTDYQTSPHAWDLSFQVLLMNKDSTTSFVAAQMIKNKIKTDFEKLPTDHQNQLKNSLLDVIKQPICPYEKSVVNQLTIAVAEIFCTMTSWTDSLNELAHSLSESVGSRKFLLDILSFIPSELNNKHLKLGLNRKLAIIDDFKSKRSTIFQILATIAAEQNDPGYQAKVFISLKAWWALNIFTFQDIQPYSQLIDNAFVVMRNPQNVDSDFYESAVLWICELLSFIHNSDPKSPMGPILLGKIYSLAPIIQCANEDISEALSFLADLVACLLNPFKVGDKFDSIVFTLDEELMTLPPVGLGDTRTLNLCLGFVKLDRKTANSEVIRTIFNAVADFSDVFLNHEIDEDIEHKRQFEIIRPFVKQIFTSLIPHCVIDEEVADLMTIEDFDSYRSEMGDALKDICLILGVEMIFVDVCSYMNDLFASLERNSGNSHEDIMQLEACLFVASILISRLNSRDPDHIISQFYENIIFKHFPCSLQDDIQMPPGHILNMLCLIYRESKRYFSYKFDHRKAVFGYLLRTFQYSLVTQDKSFTSLIRRSVTANCLSAIGHILKDSSESFYIAYDKVDIVEPTIFLCEVWPDLYHRVLVNINKIPETNEYPIQSIRDIFEGIARCQIDGVRISRRRSSSNSIHRPTPKIAYRFLVDFPERMNSLLSIPMAAIQEALQTGSSSVRERNNHPSDVSFHLQLIVSYLKNINGLFNYVRIAMEASPEHAQVIQNSINDCSRFIKDILWPLISSVMDAYPKEDRPIEYCSSCLRHSIRAFTDLLKDIVPAVAEKIVNQNAIAPHGCFLYLTSILIDQYHPNEEFHEGLLKLFQTMNLSTMALFERNGLEMDPYTVDDYFRLCLRIMQALRDKFIIDERIDVGKILDLAVASFALGAKNSCLAEMFIRKPDNSTATSVTGDGVVDEASSTNASITIANNASNDIEGKEKDPEDTEDIESAKFSAKAFLTTVLKFVSDHRSSDLYDYTQLPKVLSRLAASGDHVQLACGKICHWLVTPTSPKQSAVNCSQTTTTAQSSDDNIMCGGERLIVCLLQSWCLSNDQFDVHDVVDLYLCVRSLIMDPMLIDWLTRAIKLLPLRRSDGHEKATHEQCSEFIQKITKSQRSPEKYFKQFASLFS